MLEANIYWVLANYRPAYAPTNEFDYSLQHDVFLLSKVGM